MYNYFTDQKRKNLFAESEKREKRERLHLIKQKKLFPELVQNYSNRIKNFIFEMAGTKNPIQVKDHIKQIETTRKELFQEEEEKIRGSRGIILKGFLTEKQRIDQYLQLHHPETLDNDNDHRLKDSSKSFNFKQPEMRYKARTDLERIFDSINNYSFGRVKKDIIDKQLKGLHLTIPDVKKENLDEEPEYGKTKYDTETDKTKNRSSLILEEKKKNERSNSVSKEKIHFGRKIVDNSEARKLMKEYHNKSHFKAATDFTLFSSISPKNKMIKPVLEKIKENDEFAIDENYFGEEVKSRFEKGKVKLKKNPNNFRENESFDEEKFETLKRIVEKKNLSEMDEFSHRSKEKKVTFQVGDYNSGGSFKNIFDRVKNINFDDYMSTKKKTDEERVKIDDEYFYKKDLDLISKKVLKKCNFFHEKNKNNSKSLKTGDGKLMITGGMSINQFNKKFNFE